MSKVKLCGLRRPEDVAFANECKPDFAGFIFAPGRRQLSHDQAAELRELLDDDIQTVGVFVNANIDEIEELAEAGIIDLVQLHGDENAAYIDEVKSRTGLPVIRMVPVGTRAPSSLPQNADFLLFDTLSVKRGGTGKVFDWKLLEGIKGTPYFLAGGLHPDNVADAIGMLQPYAVDVSSGIETGGNKDGEKMRQFTARARAIETPALAVEQVPEAPAPEPAPAKASTGAPKAPGGKGRFGDFGGQYIPETLMNAVHELEEAYAFYKNDRDFNAELTDLLNNYAGRPSGLYHAKKMSDDLGGAQIYLKREDLNHTGSHKINNVLGQVLLAKKMGKTRVIAETGAGQHGVATATAAALMGMKCVVFMGKEDIQRQALNVYRMEMLGAKVYEVTSGTQTLKDAVNDTMREWTRRVHDTHYVLGSVMGPHPFPTIVRDFQAVISREAHWQILEQAGKLPAAVLACVGGGSNAMGMFHHFVPDEGVRLIGCEAAGRGVDTFETAATIATGEKGIFHGMKSLFCQDKYGQIAPVYSISAGLDYPGIGPEHAHLHDIGRAEYVPVTDAEAVDAFEYLARMEGIIPAIESAHAVAHARKIAKEFDKDECIIICLSGRGDKDVASIAHYRGEDIYE